MSLAHIAHGVCNPAASPWWLTRQQSTKWHHQNRSETYETTLTSFTSPSLTYFISPFPPRWRPRPMRRHLRSDPVPPFYPSWASLSSPSSTVPLFSPRKRAHFDTAEVLAFEAYLGETTLTFVKLYMPRCPPAPDFDALLVDRRVPAKDSASSWWLNPTPKSARLLHHSRRETSETTLHIIHLTLASHSSHSPFHPSGAQDR